jgi:hypothetical protein
MYEIRDTVYDKEWYEIYDETAYVIRIPFVSDAAPDTLEYVQRGQYPPTSFDLQII